MNNKNKLSKLLSKVESCLEYIKSYYDYNFKEIIELQNDNTKKKSIAWDDWYESVSKESALQNLLDDYTELHRPLFKEIDDYCSYLKELFEEFVNIRIDLDDNSDNGFEELKKMLTFKFESDSVGFFDNSTVKLILNLVDRYDEIINLIHKLIKGLKSYIMRVHGSRGIVHQVIGIVYIFQNKGVVIVTASHAFDRCPVLVHFITKPIRPLIFYRINIADDETFLAGFD